MKTYAILLVVLFSLTLFREKLSVEYARRILPFLLFLVAFIPLFFGQTRSAIVFLLVTVLVTPLFSLFYRLVSPSFQTVRIERPEMILRALVWVVLAAMTAGLGLYLRKTLAYETETSFADFHEEYLAPPVLFLLFFAVGYLLFSFQKHCELIWFKPENKRNRSGE